MDEQHAYTKEEVMAWRDRWKAVKEVQTEAWRKMTPDERFRELVQLFHFAKNHGLEMGQDPTQPRERWARLKKDMPIA